MTIYDLPNGAQAVQFANFNYDEIEQFVGGDSEYRERRLVVAGPDGPLWASTTDWIVRDPHGAYFVVDNVTFKTRPDEWRAAAEQEASKP